MDDYYLSFHHTEKGKPLKYFSHDNQFSNCDLRQTPSPYSSDMILPCRHIDHNTRKSLGLSLFVTNCNTGPSNLYHSLSIIIKHMNVTYTNLRWRNMNRYPCLTHCIVYCILSIHRNNIHICNTRNTIYITFEVYIILKIWRLKKYWHCHEGKYLKALFTADDVCIFPDREVNNGRQIKISVYSVNLWNELICD